MWVFQERILSVKVERRANKSIYFANISNDDYDNIILSEVLSILLLIRLFLIAWKS